MSARIAGQPPAAALRPATPRPRRARRNWPVKRDEIVGMSRRTRTEQVDLLRRLHQRVDLLLDRIEETEEIPPHVRREPKNTTRSKAPALEHFGEHRGAVGHEIAAATNSPCRRPEIGLPAAAAAMISSQSRAGVGRIKPYSAAPYAADISTAPAGFWRTTATCRRWHRKAWPACPSDDLGGFEPRPRQRRRPAPVNHRCRPGGRMTPSSCVFADRVAAMRKGGQFEAAAALVADDALETGHAGDGTEGREMRLLDNRLSTRTFLAHDLLDGGNEAVAVCGIANGGGGRARALWIRASAAPQGPKRCMAVSARSMFASAMRPLAARPRAERTGRLFIVERRQRPGVAPRRRRDGRSSSRCRALPRAAPPGYGPWAVGSAVNAPKFVQSLVSSVSRARALPRPERLA